MKKQAYIAIDLGASSGRLIAGYYENEKLQLEEMHRFTNDPVYVGERFYWDFLRIFHEIKVGLKKVAHREDLEVRTIGIDTWGVDGGWLDKSGKLITYPAHYRDSRTEDIMEDFYTKITDETLYEITGLQKMSFNTVYQLYYDQNHDEIARTFGDKWLFIPDLVGYFLTGIARNEYTIASTSALLNVETKAYDQELFDKLGLPIEKMAELINPGEILGTLSPWVQEEVGLKDVQVVAVGSHDTASAVAATPLKGANEAYLCCGTWCLMGLERDEPCANEKTRTFNFTNEGGVEGKIRFLKNINGLWFLQQIGRASCRERVYVLV